MPTVDVIDLGKKRVGSMSLDSPVFNAKADVPLVHTAVVMQQACERQGTASTKTRGEVSGAGRKPWRQKHTGRARAGSIRSPIWRHGGITFGPRPRSYAQDLPKKKYRAALQSALSAKLAEGGIVVVSDLPLEQPKTKVLAKALSQLGLPDKVLIVAGADRADLERAARNLPGVKVLRPEALNVYDVLRFDVLVIPQGEVTRIQEVWS
ncbi:MAG: 50S ribosomal protein L4 [Nitrospirales bacterium]